MTNLYYLGIGSNLGNRKRNISRALDILSKTNKIVKISSIIETKPMYYLKQDNFLNAVVIIETKKSPSKLLETLQKIEKTLGRKRVIKKGPRIIDLDILFYNDEIINESNLVIPHPLLHERKFVLRPLVEVNSELTHPILKKSVKDLLVELTNRKVN